MKIKLFHFKRLFYKPIALILAIILTAVTVTLTLILLPVVWLIFFIYRCTVIIVAKFKMPNCEILKTFNSICSLGSEYTSTHFYITVQTILEGRLSFEDAKKECTKMCNKLNSNGELQHPELRDCYEYFGGYTFRRRIKNFDPSNYIHCHKEMDNAIIDKLRMLEIRKKITYTLFEKNHPLWEFTLINNYRHNNSENDPECTAVIFKFQHTLTDGFGAASLIYKNFAGVDLNLPKIDKSTLKYQCSKPFQFFSAMVAVWNVTFDSVLGLIYSPSRVLNTHAWHELLQPTPLKYEVWLAEPINKRIFREIKATNKISAMCVLLSVITGGMKTMMVAKGLVPPKEMRIGYPIPAPNHPGSLTNHAYGTCFRVPVSIQDSKKRLQAIKARMNSSFADAILSKYLSLFGDVMPHCLKDVLIFDRFMTSAISSTPVPSTGAKLLGHKQISVTNVVATDRTTMACFVNVVGLDDNFHVSIQMNSRLLSHPDEVRDLEKYMLEELDFIGKECLT